MVAVITDEASFDQVDGHLSPGLQLYGHNVWEAVFKVLAILFVERRHHLVVDQQVSAGGQSTASGSYPVDGDCEAVHTSAGNGEHTRQRIVAAAQVDEDVLVRDKLVDSEGAIAGKIVAVVQSDWEGAAAGCKYNKLLSDAKDLNPPPGFRDALLTSDIVESRSCLGQLSDLFTDGHVKKPL